MPRLVVFWLALAAAAAAQDRQGPQFRSTIEVFRLDVSVLDRERRPIRGLTADDFVIFEDGKAQKIVSVAEVDVPEAPEPTAAWMLEHPHDVTSNQLAERRLFVLVLDDATISQDPWAVQAVTKIGNAFVDRLGPRDLMAVVFTLDNRRSQDFTSDRAKLRAAIGRFTRVGGFGSSHFTLETLVRISEYLVEVPDRRKAILYVGPGVGVDFGAAAAPSTSPGREGAVRAVQRVYALLAATQRANVNIYTFDPEGLRLSPTDLSVQFLQLIADRTGGRGLINTNEFTEGIEAVFRENSSYYILGYESSAAKGLGHYRRIQVRVNRPDTEVRARTMHYGEDPNQPRSGAQPPGPALRALSGLLPEPKVPLRVSVAPFAIPGQQTAAVTAVIEVSAPESRPGEAPIEQNVELVVSAFTPEGQPRGSQRQTARIAMKPTATESVPRYELVTRIDLKPGAYQLRFAVADSGGKAGSTYADVEVPDFTRDRLALSGMIVTAGDRRERRAGTDALADIVPHAPTVQREFARTGRAAAFLRVYQGVGSRTTLAPVDLSVRVIDDRDEIVVKQAEVIPSERFTGDRVADIELDLPLPRLRPGAYLLEVTVTADTISRIRHLRFEVR